MLDWLRDVSAARDPVAPDPPDDPANDWDFDPNAPATFVPIDLQRQLADTLRALDRLADVLTPGMPGVEGAEQWPTLAHDALTVGDTTPITIRGNRHRTSILIHNLGDSVVYVVADGATNASAGMPIPVNAEREIRTPNPIRLIAASGTASVRILEESS